MRAFLSPGGDPACPRDGAVGTGLPPDMALLGDRVRCRLDHCVLPSGSHVTAEDAGRPHPDLRFHYGGAGPSDVPDGPGR